MFGFHQSFLEMSGEHEIEGWDQRNQNNEHIQKAVLFDLSSFIVLLLRNKSPVIIGKLISTSKHDFCMLPIAMKDAMGTPGLQLGHQKEISAFVIKRFDLYNSRGSTPGDS